MSPECRKLVARDHQCALHALLFHQARPLRRHHSTSISSDSTSSNSSLLSLAIVRLVCASSPRLLPKLTMGHQNIWFSHPRKFGPGSRHCRVCSNHHGLIRKYGLHMCRRCFRQYANQIGFKKLD